MQSGDRQNAGRDEKPVRFSPLSMVARALGARHESDAFTATLQPVPDPDFDIPPVGVAPPQPPPMELPAPVVGEGFVALMNAMLAPEGDFVLEPEDESCDLAALTAEVREVFEAQARAAGQVLVFEFAPTAEGEYRGDVQRLRQALLNLVSGALKAAEGGALSVQISRRDEALTFDVRSPEAAVAMARLVARQARPSARTPGQGLGQALACATALGGVVRVTAGVGVEMSVPFARVGGEASVPEPVRAASNPPPVARAPEPPPVVAPGVAPEPVVSAPAYSRSQALDGLRVLVAESAGHQRQVLGAVLAGLGVDAVIVGDAQEAVSAWRQERFDLLLIDVDGEEIAGRGLIRSIRAAETTARWPHMPILVLASDTREIGRDEAFAEMIDGVLPRPVTAGSLEAAFGAMMDDAPAAAAPVGFSRSAAF